MNEPKATATVIVPNPQGLHLRPLDMFVKLAVQFQSRIEVVKGGWRVDGKSIMDMLTLTAESGAELQLEATGPDAQSAIDALVALVQSGFGE